MNESLLPYLAKVAKAGKYLFWITFVYGLVWLAAYFVTEGFVKMNPVSRSSIIGRVVWYAPGIQEGGGILASLVPLYLFQSSLNAGCKRGDILKMQAGLRYLYYYICIVAVFQGLKLLVEYGMPGWFWN